MMKKICFVVALLACVLMSTTAMAASANKELCLAATSNSGVTSTHILSYTALSAGHVLFYGESCYTIPETNGSPGAVDCLPVHGSGIIYENKFEIAVEGVENNADFGIDVFTSGQSHFWISTETLTGTYASESTNYIEGEKFQDLDRGTVAAVKCPAVPKSELDADRRFQQLIKQLDALGNVE